jgi:plastocyanin
MSSRTERQAARRRADRQRYAAIAAMAAVVVVASVLLATIVGGDDDGDGGTTPTPTATVSMVEMAFEPDPIVATAGDAVLRVVNDGALPHSLVVVGAGKGTPDLPPGEEMTVDLRDLEAGSYRVICDIPGHVEAGMETTLVLE